MDTYFAPPERLKPDELNAEIAEISNNDLINSLLHSVGGLLAVLNEQRQILSVNTTLLKTLGISDAARVLGLRPGEMLQCVHSSEMPGGCGTAKACLSCGAAIAIVSGLQRGEPAEQNCCISSNSGKDIFLNVRACPIRFHGYKLLLLFLRDCTQEQQNAAISRVFFHDLNNSLTALLGMSELLQRESAADTLDLADAVQRISLRISNEIRIQQYLQDNTPEDYLMATEPVVLTEIFSDFSQIHRTLPALQSKTLRLPEQIEPLTLVTDRTLLMRVLHNLLVNAFEADPPGSTVSFMYKKSPGTTRFSVQNSTVIPDHLKERIFQRNFSTKAEQGRGLGTWSAKLFGEKFLGGRVGFTSEPESGTVFYLELPLDA